MPEIDDYARRWRVEPTGPAFSTASSELLPGRRDAVPVMLKLARVDEERRGAAVLAGWAGVGAATVLEREGDALLMRRATGPRRLERLAVDGRDDEATGILCDALAVLHAVPDAGAEAPGARIRMRALLQEPDPAHPDPALHRRAAAVMQERLGDRMEPTILLHGDAHHGNVLDFGDHESARWLAIDPKGVRGPRVFDHLALFLNPDPSIAVDRLPRRLAIVGERLALDDLAAWVLGYAMLSAAWSIDDGADPTTALTVAAAVSRIGTR